MPTLFEPLTIRSVTLRNRFAVSPMCMYCSIDGHATDFHLVHLGARALGGFGLILAEATAVTPEGRISPDDAGLWQDSQIEPLARITHFLKQHGSTPGVQLAHAGRKASTSRPWGHLKPHSPIAPQEPRGWHTVAPSAIPFDEGYSSPHALTVPEILHVQHDFAEAAHRAIHAGYEVIELHAAHGYLINEFLSPLSNHRTDDYGGSFDNRCRFLLETVREVRKIWNESRPLLVRLSCTDWADDKGGWTLEDSIALSKRLKAESVDLIDCSSGNLIPPSQAKIPFAAGFQVPFAEAIRRQTGILTGAVGMITEAAQAASIVVEGQADLVLFAREALRDPSFPIRAARKLNARENITIPGQYLRA